MSEKVGPTPLGKFVIFLFIVGLIVLAGYYFRDTIFPTKSTQQTVDIDKFKQQQGGAEAQDPTGITTVTEYKYVPEQKLPAVKGTSNYK